jgi:hypothetical protein
MKPPVRERERERLSAAIMEEICKNVVVDCVVRRKFDAYPRTVAHLRSLFDARDAADRMLADVVRSHRSLRSSKTS